MREAPGSLRRRRNWRREPPEPPRASNAASADSSFPTALGFGRVEAGTDNLVETLARLSLFADLPHPQVEALAHTFAEEVFSEGQRVMRQGMAGGGFYVIRSEERRVGK